MGLMKVAPSWQLPSKWKCDLLCCSDIPVHQKVPFILHGYRPEPESTCGLLKTIFTVHNETGNIWTHLLGFFYIVLLMVEVVEEMLLADSLERGESLWVLSLILATAFCLLCSCIYHLCNCTGRNVKECMYRMDLTGIAALISVSYFSGIGLAFHCHPRLRKCYLVYSAGIVIALMAPLMRSQLADLTTHFIVCVTVGLIPAVHFVVISTADDVAVVVPYLVAMFGCYGAGAFFYIQKWPERVWPGKFDLFGHSHQLWHVFVLLAAVSWVRGSIVMHKHFTGLDC